MDATRLKKRYSVPRYPKASIQLKDVIIELSVRSCVIVKIIEKCAQHVCCVYVFSDFFQAEAMRGGFTQIRFHYKALAHTRNQIQHPRNLLKIRHLLDLPVHSLKT